MELRVEGFFWITFHVGIRPDCFSVTWAVHARLRQDVKSMSTILSAASDQVPGWNSYRYRDATVASDHFRLDAPDFATDVRPRLHQNLLLGARFLLAHGDLRRAAEYATSQRTQPARLRAFDLYIHLDDGAAARKVVDVAATAPDAQSEHVERDWAARRKLVAPSVLA